MGSDKKQAAKQNIYNNLLCKKKKVYVYICYKFIRKDQLIERK